MRAAIVSLIGLLAAGAAHAAPSCEIKDYGILAGARGDAQIQRRTDTIPARIGLRFGLIHELRDIPREGQLEARIHHPPIALPGGGTKTYSGGRMNPASNGTGFSFDEPGELKTGRWRFEVRYGDQVLCGRDFNVVADSPRSERYDNPVDGRTYVAPGGWESYQPKDPRADAGATGKVRTQHIRLLSAQSEIAANVGVESLTEYIKRVEKEATEVFSAAAKGAVLVQINAGPQRQEIKLAYEGDVDKALLQQFYERLTAMERLKVKEREISFQAQFAIVP